MTCAQFIGFNGFEQFACIGNCANGFQDFQIPTDKNIKLEASNISCYWNYNVVGVGQKLFISGCINGTCIHNKEIQFKNRIKKVASNANFCLVLLENGFAYKVKLENLETVEINTKIFRKTGSLPVPKKCLFNDNSSASAGQQNEYITHLATGRSMTIAISSENNLYNIPMHLWTFPKHVKVKKVCCGNEHCLILTTNGDVYSFGSSSRGQLGLENLNSEEQPQLIEALAGIKIIDIAAGGWHSAAISAFGDLYTWGWNVNGQLGLPNYEEIELKYENGVKEKTRRKLPSVFPTPQLIELPNTDNESGEDDADPNSEYNALKVCAGVRHTIVTTESGATLGTGWNCYGQLGVSDKEVCCFEEISIDLKAGENVEILSGDWCTIAIFDK